jgi:rubrerythrin
MEVYMSFLIQSGGPDVIRPRRAFLSQSGLLLSGAAIALMAGRDALAAKEGAGGNDAHILNTALAGELEAIAAYQLGADSGLLQKPVRELALTFQSQHRAHAATISGSIRKLGGTPAEPKKHYDFPTASLKSQDDVLRFAAKLEQGAISAYLSAVPLFHDRDLSHAAASILGDEAMHWAALRQALGEAPVPVAFMS